MLEEREAIIPDMVTEAPDSSLVLAGVTLEHAVCGQLMITIGLERFFFHGG